MPEEKNGNGFKKKIWVTITSVFVIVGGLTGILKWDDRYAKSSELDAMELESVQTFKDTQEYVQTQIDGVKKENAQQEKINDIETLQMKSELVDIQIEKTEEKIAETTNDQQRTIEQTKLNTLLQRKEKIEDKIESLFNTE